MGMRSGGEAPAEMGDDLCCVELKVVVGGIAERAEDSICDDVEPSLGVGRGRLESDDVVAGYWDELFVA